MRIDQMSTSCLLDISIAGEKLRASTRTISIDKSAGPLRPKPIFFAVRQTDGYLWVDINTWGYTADTSWEKAAQTNKEIEDWATANPVVAVIQADIVPHDEGR